MAINFVAAAIGYALVIEPIVIFVLFWRLMGITQAILRLFSTMLVSVMVYFLLFVFLFYIKNVVLDSVIFLLIFAIASYIMYRSHKEHKDEMVENRRRIACVIPINRQKRMNMTMGSITNAYPIAAATKFIAIQFTL